MNSKFGVRMHLGMIERHVSVFGSYDFVSRIIMSPILLEIGIPNLVCGCILGWQSVMYQFWVTVTLTLFLE